MGSGRGSVAADEDGIEDEATTLAVGYPTGLFVGPSARPDRYELLGPPLEGTEGVTWRARYLGALDQPVQIAVKVLKRPSGVTPSWPGADLLDGWQDRVELLRSAAIPGLVRLYGVEAAMAPHAVGDRTTPSTVIVEMEWVEGRQLTDEVLRRPATPATMPERLDWLRDLAAAVSGLHGLDTAAVHRDVAPGNCIITPQRRLVLVDLSTMQLPVDESDLLGRHTPAYSAPEVLAAPGAWRHPAADRWAVGAMAYFCLTGSHPARSALARGEALREAVGRVGGGAGAVDAVLALLDDDPERRPADLVDWVGGLAAELRRVPASGVRGRGRSLTRIRPIALVQVLCGAATAAVVALLLGFVPVLAPSAVRSHQPLVAAGVVALLGLVLLLLPVLRRRFPPWVAALAAPVAAALAAAGAVRLLHQAPGPETAALVLGAGLLGAGSVSAVTTPARSATRTAVAAALAVVAIVTFVVLREAASVQDASTQAPTTARLHRLSG